MLAGLLAGTLLTLVSPGLWNRAAHDPAVQTIIQLLLTTLPLLSVLLIIIAVCMFTAPTRRYILMLARGE